MSRQQTRSSGDGAIDPSLVQKKRARHRLVGAICLCLVAAVVVPLVLESEPRPRDRDLPLELAAPPRNAGAEPAAGPVAAAGSNAPDASAASTAPATAGNASPAPASKPPESKPMESKPAPKAASKTEAARPDASRSAAKPSDAPGKPPARADEPDVLARLIDRSNNPASGAAARDGADRVARRFLVQIGAFSNVQSARSVSDRAVQAGLRPYQETVKTAQGDWIRVRVGPFTTRQDAERAQQDLKRAGVTAAIIAL